MSNLAFLNMISSAAPPRGDEYKIGCIGFAMAVENEAGDLVHLLARRVALPGGRHLDPDWAARYGIAEWGPDVEYIEPAQAAAEAIEALRGVTQTAAHFVQFHRKQLERLILDGAGSLDVPEITDMDWFDTMHKSTMTCAIPGRSGRAFKPPSLAEATQALTGEPLRPIEGMHWQDALLVNLSAVRAIYHRLAGRPTPAHLAMVGEAMP